MRDLNAQVRNSPNTDSKNVRGLVDGTVDEYVGIVALNRVSGRIRTWLSLSGSRPKEGLGRGIDPVMGRMAGYAREAWLAI
ncbi:hypothetical protein HSRCO_0214 [Halanaeroarchaeum sp. HSR-CO]|nr:hypothetical protein HSRCO_0214 [Halanaeroarchaeum sp. HSR-CO]